MAKPKLKIPPAESAWGSEVRLLAWLAACVSVLSFLVYAQRGETMLYGDAVAHMNIARRVFDSKTPGLLQLGTVWLPLPHLLMIPFVLSDAMWQKGAAAFPSLFAYMFAVVGLFRLVRGTLSSGKAPDLSARVAAWFAAAVFAANPNLIYMQSTAMGEALYLALYMWSVVYFSEWLRGDKKALTKSGLCLAAACLTRYDAWFLAAAMVAAVLLRAWFAADQRIQAKSRASILKFALLAGAAPVFWLAYNGIIYHNPLEFENGPYSAKAIEKKTQSPNTPGHPGSGNLAVAGLYFVKAAEANVAENVWLQRGWIFIFLLGITAAAVHTERQRRSSLAVLLFLLVPVPFYALSVAYGGVPIFVPQWWPFTHYNVRYGLQLLPAFSVCLGLLVFLALESRWNARVRGTVILILATFAIASYVSASRATPVTVKEAENNMRTRNQLEAQVAAWLKKLPPDATLLMYLGDHVGAVQRAGIPLSHVVNEGNHRVWKQPVDSEGLWEQALADPTHHADYIVAFDGDPVWQAVQGRGLSALVEIHVTGQSRAVLYRAR